MMTHRERVMRALSREPVDQLACGDGLWGETAERYTREGYLKPDESHAVHFDMSWRAGGWLTSTADLDFVPVVLEETEETILKLDGNGAQLRYWKGRSGTPEHVAFDVMEREAWERKIKPHLLAVDRRRLKAEEYRTQRALAAKEQRAFFWGGVAPFEQIHPVCGHEYMLMGMALDPDWVKDMVMTYARMTRLHLEVLFKEEGVPDALWFYEDMGFKEKPFMSPEMYAEIVQPGHAYLFDWAHELGCKVMVHSCGYVEPLVPGLIEAGMDCLQAMEVKAGMDLPHLARRFGEKIAFCGGVDIRELESNDLERVDRELERRVRPVLQQGCGYILHTDHSIPPGVDYRTLRHFFDHGRTLNNR